MIWAMRFPPEKGCFPQAFHFGAPRNRKACILRGCVPPGAMIRRLVALPKRNIRNHGFLWGISIFFGDTIGMLFFLERVMGYDAIIYRKPRKYNLNDIHNFPRSKKTRFPTNRAFETTPTNRMQHKPKCSGMEFSSFTTRITQIHVHI